MFFKDLISTLTVSVSARQRAIVDSTERSVREPIRPVMMIRPIDSRANEPITTKKYHIFHDAVCLLSTK